MLIYIVEATITSYHLIDTHACCRNLLVVFLSILRSKLLRLFWKSAQAFFCRCFETSCQIFSGQAWLSEKFHNMYQEISLYSQRHWFRHFQQHGILERLDPDRLCSESWTQQMAVFSSSLIWKWKRKNEENSLTCLLCLAPFAHVAAQVNQTVCRIGCICKAPETPEVKDVTNIKLHSN